MGLIWWIIFLINLLLVIGIMLTYVSRNDYKGRRSEEVPISGYRPKTLVILPIKGVDYELEKNLRSLKFQDYSPFDLVAVVDSEEDPSIPYLEKGGVGYTVSSMPCGKCSGKVKAIYSALREYGDYDAYVVADSDIRPPVSWLRKLLEPLSTQDTGVTTTFPSFYPHGGYWSKMKMYWGLVGRSMMESNLTLFVWGGSMAFRKDLIDREALETFSESVSDDIAILRIAKGKNLRISYVPESMPQIYSTDNFKTFIEWSNRQTAFSIYSSRKVFVFGTVYYLASVYLLISSILFSVLVNYLFVIFLFPYLYNSVNSQRKVPIRVWYFLSFTLILPFVYLWNLFSGIIRKRVSWRGTTYSLSRQ